MSRDPADVHSFFHLMEQSIRYLKTPDGVGLAWSSAGEGPTLIKAGNWLTHLEYDLESPVWRHWIHFLAQHFQLIRHDERGCGMTDWDVTDISFDLWVEDLEALVAAAAPRAPFALLGVSQGAAIAITYAHRHPDLVSHLILYGGYARGVARRGDEAGERRFRAIVELADVGWGKENPVFRDVFTSRFFPGGSDEQLRWFSELCARTTRPDIASRLLWARAEVDVEVLLPELSVPTLVVHARDDEVVPFEEGRLLASEIPDAEFVMLDSANHILLEDEPAWRRFQEVVLRFTGRPISPGVRDPATGESPPFQTLSTREREILAKLTEGCTNAEVGKALFISEKTVRNHLTHIFEKLGVHSRAQAIVKARDEGFEGGGGSRQPPGARTDR